MCPEDSIYLQPNLSAFVSSCECHEPHFFLRSDSRLTGPSIRHRKRAEKIGHSELWDNVIGVGFMPSRAQALPQWF